MALLLENCGGAEASGLWLREFLRQGDKETLEIEKLRLEIAHLDRPWWKNASYLAALVPIILGSLTFFAASVSGWFDQERGQLIAEKEKLSSDRDQLILEQNVLMAENDRLIQRRNELAKDVGAIRDAFERIKESAQRNREAFEAVAEEKGVVYLGFNFSELDSGRNSLRSHRPSAVRAAKASQSVSSDRTHATTKFEPGPGDSFRAQVYPSLVSCRPALALD